jgi:hypothetical protein
VAVGILAWSTIVHAGEFPEHWSLIYYVARTAGYDEQDARVIADASWAVDQNADTTATPERQISNVLLPWLKMDFRNQTTIPSNIPLHWRDEYVSLAMGRERKTIRGEAARALQKTGALWRSGASSRVPARWRMSQYRATRCRTN